MIDLKTQLADTLCKALCAEVQLVNRPGNIVAVSTPLTLPDGDSVPMFIRLLPSGGLEFTDLGNSLMRLSYDTDPAALKEGTRERVLNQILAEYGLTDRQGEISLAVPGDEIGVAAFRFSQAMTRIHDISLLNRSNVESTFYEDLLKDLQEIVPSGAITPNYIVPTVSKAADYPVDFFIAGARLPLYVFGVPNKDKARLATIVIQHLLGTHDFDTTIVFRNADDLPRGDVNRLVNVANDVVTSSDATTDLHRKIRHRLAA